MTSKRFDCACGWTVTTPHGDQDLVEAVSWHLVKIHPDMKMSRQDIIKMAKAA